MSPCEPVTVREAFAVPGVSSRGVVEISDLVVDYDPDTLARRDVRKADAIERARELPRRARRIVGALPSDGEYLDRAAVDGILLRSHLELQRLHEEFRVGDVIRAALARVLDLVRAIAPPPIRVVDLGCGLGFVIRWLAARGRLGDDVELVGADYNGALIAAAQRLADAERLPCRFAVANAFRLAEPAHVVMSTGVLHHFRGAALDAVFAEHERSPALAFLHADIRPGPLASLGSWIFHQARMREPLARFDGYWSAVRAHDAAALRAAIARGAPSFALGMLDTRASLPSLLQIFQLAIGVRAPHAAALDAAFAPLGRRYAPAVPR